MPSAKGKVNQNIAACYCLHDDAAFLEASIRSLGRKLPVRAYISRVPWNAKPGAWEACVKIAKSAGAVTLVGDWRDEQEHRRSALRDLKEAGFEFALIPDGDEILDESLVDALLDIAAVDLADRVYVHMDTYWKSPNYVIRPREAINPLMLVHLDRARQVFIRHFQGGKSITLGPGHGLMHHLSYAGPDERIQRKLETWSHRTEVVSGWFERVWKAWDHDKHLSNLHPTHPQAYGFAEHVGLNPRLLQVGFEPEPPRRIATPPSFPTVSVAIPLYGGPEDIRLCLKSLAECLDLLQEVIVVDNRSLDGADEVAASFEFVKLVRNPSNKGFAAASNQGYLLSSGEIVLFLNSDTIVPRAGLIRLIESITKSGSIAATGPRSNVVSGIQQCGVTYTSLETLGLFANDFAECNAEDFDVDMLFGFCLAVRRSVLDEIGSFDEAFGIGMFEDNDLSYRIRRAGYRLVVSGRAFVHHAGSKSMGRAGCHPVALFRKNHKIFLKKWERDIESGFASHLSGLGSEQIRFSPERHPDVLARRVAEMKKQARISLCIIVKDEERVLRDCLNSAIPFFSQIVVVDTGSTDKTVEIAKEFGCEVYKYPWTESFSEARNESMRHAEGDWIFWMDADDTLPWKSGELILQGALAAPKELLGFVVPVRFTGEQDSSGTRVDHVKLFRNLPGLTFEGRIHEQILPSIREKGGAIARLEAIVLHSGYDTSAKGQAKKRARDDRLLKLDFEERPDHPFVLFNLGMTAHYSGEHAKAISWLQRCLEISDTKESHVRKAYALLSNSQRECGNLEGALATLERGLEVEPDDPELHFLSGLLLAALGKVDEAITHYQAISPDISGHFSSVDLGILGHKRYFNLGTLYLLKGDYAEAKRWFLKAIDGNRQSMGAYYALFEAAFKVRDDPTIVEVLGRIKALEGVSSNWVDLSIKYAELTGGEKNVEAFLEDAATRMQEAQPALMLARRYLETGRETKALPLLTQLERTGSAEAAYLLGIYCIRTGDLTRALRHMEIAHELNPEHALTCEQLGNLRAAIANQERFP